MADQEITPGRRVTTRERGTNTRVGGGKVKRKVATGPDPVTGKQREFGSAGRYTDFDRSGNVVEDAAYRNKMRNIRNAANSLVFGEPSGSKTAALFGEGMLGGADIVDSQNVGYYSYEFPVDALELPQSRAEELRFYRLAYDRDPIVSRAINMHTELPLSKMTLEKPKCSSEEFKDYIFDFYQGLCNDKMLFQTLIDGAREYWMLGETFYYIEEKQQVDPCPAAKKQLEEGDDGEGTEAGSESRFNPPMGGTADEIMDWIEPTRKASLVAKFASRIDKLRKEGMQFSPDESLTAIQKLIKEKRAELLSLQRKVGKVIGRINPKDEYPIQVTAAPGDPGEPPAGDTPADVPNVPGGGVEGDPAAGEGAAPGDEGAPLGDAGMADVAVPSGGDIPMGGGGGGTPVTPADLAGDVKDAVARGVSLDQQRELMQMRHYLKLLERKKELLKELQELREQRKEEMELFSHVTNPKYRGFFKIQILPPEQMELANDGGSLSDGPTIYYKPPEAQKEQYLEDENTPEEVKEKIQEEGKIPLNQDPFRGSYVIHFARKKSGYELHGRSAIQPVIRSCIYREKLRQVQSTIASRNMTPKTMVVAPGIPMSEVLALRAHIDEAKADPDYTIVVNYDAQWNEIGSEARLLALDGEYQHTNSDLAIGLGLSPEILIGEGLYSGNRIQLEILNTAYLQFRDLITNIVEDKIFKPIAMKKGFYETDKWGRPRWIYPKVTFSRMALRDSGDLYDMMFNLYAKGSLPVEIIYEFLNIDPEDCTRKLEDSLFTVRDAKFNELLSNLYSSMAELILQKSDLLKRVIEGLTLNEVDNDDEGPEGSGEGM